MRDAAAALLDELRSLSERELRLTLNALSVDERRDILAMLETRKPPVPSFEALAGLSPWLITKIEAARRGESQSAQEGLTAATRTVLLRAVDEISKPKKPTPSPGPPRTEPILKRLFGSYRKASPA